MITCTSIDQQNSGSRPDGADDAEPDSIVTVTFSEPLDPRTVTEGALRLLDGDHEVAGTFELSSKRDALSFTPAEPLSLWTKYRVELVSTLKDRDGASLVEAFSADFQVRDGVWSVQTLAEGTSLKLPRMLPITADGSLLPTWLAEEGTTCTAAGTWALRGKTKPSWLFKSTALDGECTDLSASVASDGNAAVSWVAGNQDYSQTFVSGAWASAERMNTARGSSALYSSTVFVHDGATMTTMAMVGGGQNSLVTEIGTMRGAWKPASQSFVLGSASSSITGSLDPRGSGFAVWSRNVGIETSVLRFDSAKQAWDAAPSSLPGSKVTGATAGPRPNIATTPEGDALVVFGGRTSDARWLKSSRYTPSTGWQVEPTNVYFNPSIEPLKDAPALAYDGSAFVAAWTAAYDGNYVAYSARYDWAHDSWELDEPHVTPLGESALLMPRLGADARGNLLLVWALAGAPTKLAYQRYRAESGEWGEIQQVPGVAMVDPTVETVGKLPFALAPNSVGGLLFKSAESGTETVKLAEFF